MRRADSPSVLVARTQVRSRLRSLLVLGVLTGVTAGFVIASLSGALRTGSALDRLREQENAPDAVVFASQVHAGAHPDWSRLEARPEVTRVAPWGLAFGVFGPGGPPGVPEGPSLLFASMDGTYLGDVGRPIVVEGRMYDPDADDEVVIDENTSGEVGDVLDFTAYAPDEDPFSGPASGVHLDVEVVGRVKTLAQFLFLPDGQAFLSPGFAAEHGDDALLVENADVQLRNGAADIAALQRSVDDVVAPGTPVLDLHEAARRVGTTTTVERTALNVLAAVILLAGLVLVGQAVLQSASAAADDLPTLSAMGMTRRAVSATSLLVHTPTALTAAAAAGTALVASIWFPIGMGGRLDPDRGVQPTWTVLVPGVLLVALAVLVGAGTATWFRRQTRARSSPPSSALAGIRRATPVPVGLGATMALGSSQGTSRLPARQALVGAAVGVLGVVATITLNAGLTDALDHPERAGVAWDAGGIVAGEGLQPDAVSPELLETIAATPGVAAIATIDRQVLPVDGVGVPTFAVRPTPGADVSPIDLVLTSGRAPEGTDEAAIGPASAADLGVGVGDEVTVGATDQQVSIVGEALFPTDVHATFDEGLWLDGEGFDRAAPAELNEVEGVQRQVAIEIADGASEEEVVAALQASVGDQFEDLGPAVTPVELSNLENVRMLPRVLAGFLALLAVGALGHVLATAARRRRQDFAVLRALGLTRWDSRVVLNVQGTVIGLVGLLVGIPAGIALGQLGWAVVAESVPLAVVQPVAALAVAALIPLALLVANGLAVWPGRRVARLRPGEVLRTE
ncbi:MAG: FtsX-like permease family protein [Acidimicrobiales bacterium]